MTSGLTEYPNIQPNPAHHLIACLMAIVCTRFSATGAGHLDAEEVVFVFGTGGLRLLGWRQE